MSKAIAMQEITTEQQHILQQQLPYSLLCTFIISKII